MINYRIVGKKNPQTKAMKYYAQLRSNGAMSLEQIAENISRECTVHMADIKAVLTALEEQIILALQNGNTVCLGNLGSFRLTLHGKGADTREKFNTGLIRGIRVRFLRSTTMRSGFTLQNDKVKFNLVDEGSKASSDTGENPGA